MTSKVSNRFRASRVKDKDKGKIATGQLRTVSLGLHCKMEIHNKVVSRSKVNRASNRFRASRPKDKDKEKATDRDRGNLDSKDKVAVTHPGADMCSPVSLGLEIKMEIHNRVICNRDYPPETGLSLIHI